MLPNRKTEHEYPKAQEKKKEVETNKQESFENVE